MVDAMDDRITIDPDNETLEVDFSHLSLGSAASVDALFDRIEAKITESGHDTWYFLVNYRNFKIAMAARPAFSRRGSRMNVAHSLGTVRFDASEETRAEIENRPNTDYFGENFFADRDQAVARIAQFRAAKPDARKAGKLAPSQYSEADFAKRLRFLDDIQVMDVDFSDFSFDNTSDVNGFYDYIEKRIAENGRKWYFLVNYRNCVITLKAWVSFARRGKRLNIASSLGSVRYDTSPETEAEIRMRAKKQDFQPNIRHSREDALARIEEMKHAASAEAAH